MSAMANIGAMPLGIVSAGVAVASQLPQVPAVVDAPAQPPTAQPAATTTMSASAAPVALPPLRAAETHASVAHPIHPVAAPSAAGAVGGTVFALLFVVALIFALSWLAKRMPGLAKSSNASLKLVASLPLGPRERVVVVDVGGTQLLLGVGAGGTRTLHTLDAPLPAVEREKLNVPPFAQLLAQHFGKKS